MTESESRNIISKTMLPPGIKDKIRIAESMGQRYYLMHPYGQPDYSKQYTCTNCYDQKALGVMVVISDGHSTPPKVPKDSGYITTGQLGNGWALVDVDYHKCHICNDTYRQIDYYLMQSGLLPDEYNWQLDYLRAKPGKDIAYEAANQILQQQSPTGWLLVYGDYGMGKSGLLKSMVAQFCKRGINARYVRASDYLNLIRESYGNGGQPGQDAALIREFAGVRLLAVDEVDRISNTDWAKEQIFTMLDSRYNLRESTATIIATNQNPDELPGYLASRALDGTRVQIAGQSLRGMVQSTMQGGA